jgi:hypothetical protein
MDDLYKNNIILVSEIEIARRCLSSKTWSTFGKNIYNCNSQWCEHCIL